MNGTAYNHHTHTLNIPYTLIQPVITGKQLSYETIEQQAIRHYEDFILDIIKVMDLQCITHCTDDDYQLITIQGADNTLILIKPSKTLRKGLLKQKKEQRRFIKTGVNRIQQASLLPNGNQDRTSNLITNDIWKMTDEDGRDEWHTWKMTRWRMIHDNRRDEWWMMIKGDMK